MHSSRVCRPCRPDLPTPSAVANLHGTFCPEPSMRWPMTVAVGCLTLITLGTHRRPERAARTVTVSITCPGPNGQRQAVQPWQAQLHVGDAIAWNLVQPILSDTIMIGLKDSSQAWPFHSPRHPRGRHSATAQGAFVVGHYAYNITLRCPVRGGPPAFITIDPDIIINE